MKKYYFDNGKVEAENLDAASIKKYEEKMGELESVYVPRIGNVPCRYDWRQKAYQKAYMEYTKDKSVQ